MYKLLDKETGLYNSGGTNWTKRGKVWIELGHLKTKLSAFCLPRLDMDIHKLERALVPPYSSQNEGYMSYRERLNRARQENEELRELIALREDTKRRGEVYKRYLPDSWVVLKVAEVEEINPISLFKE